MRSAICALEGSAGYAVQALTPRSNIQPFLTHALGVQATVFEVSDYLGFDMEVFLKVGASSLQSAAVRAALESDPRVESISFLDHAAAYRIFAKDFSDQPALLQSTKPSDLPESFRVDLQLGASVPRTVKSYRNLSAVATVITHNGSQFAPVSGSVMPKAPVSACTKPKP